MDQLSATDIRLRRRAALISVGVGVVLLLVKFAAYLLTHSTAVLSDALESIVNVVASMFALFSVTMSSRPADNTHPYGHGKVEFFAAGFEGAMIVLAAALIIWSAVPGLINPPPLGPLDVGVVLLTVGGVANYLLGTYLIRTGRKARSDALVADGHHVHTDAYTSAGVIVGLILVSLTGWLRLDPFIAILVAINILVTGRRLIRASTAGLMDESDPAFLERIVAALARIRQPGWIWPHLLRARRSGAVWHVDFHLVLPRYWDLARSHQVQKVIEPALLSKTNELGQVLAHFDPCTDTYCPLCDMADCAVRAAPFARAPEWTVATVLADTPYRRPDAVIEIGA